MMATRSTMRSVRTVPRAAAKRTSVRRARSAGRATSPARIGSTVESMYPVVLAKNVGEKGGGGWTSSSTRQRNVRKISAVKLVKRPRANQAMDVDFRMRQTSRRLLFQRKIARRRMVSSVIEMIWRGRRKGCEVYGNVILSRADGEGSQVAHLEILRCAQDDGEA